ncbi:taurine catabolism dioxygenase [Plenodomus tracheiphilus IPT5]|uniref:Taurine catabolism dioxygenase n=1 Tax=Plenodomus tracheiphilus IPT5 TaxID=1408161 RepID=A0A6A7B7Y1_9PLEO|nr:taurine catabolism dioxygenase [Plenodomus tracheiphilus IPT5]
MATEILTSAPSQSQDASVPTTTPTDYPRKPLELKGVLDSFQSFDVTPVIGREFSNVNLKDWLRAPNSDELIRDLAITISQRGVVFFRKQDDLDNDLQKELAQRLGELSGKPSSSKLHIHPVSNSGRRLGGNDDEISVISSEQAKEIFKERLANFSGKKQSAKDGWHSDITFEPVPSDYALLRLTELPKTGGDTLWASGYELYDRLSPPYQRFFESLTATYSQPEFNRAAASNNFALYTAPRGSPDNTGSSLTAIHPVIRTNPVTGWKSVFAVGHHVQHINGLTKEESATALNWFVQLITENHDLQVRHRWTGVNDLAIWDNRSVYHTATYDYTGLGKRTGQRAVSLGEKPYLDAESLGRREALGEWGEQ